MGASPEILVRQDNAKSSGTVLIGLLFAQLLVPEEEEN